MSMRPMTRLSSAPRALNSPWNWSDGTTRGRLCFSRRGDAFRPGSPLIGHIGYGRFEIAGLDTESLRRLEKLALVLGGCAPTAWGEIMSRGMGPLLSETEHALAVSLKRELDPEGILNPHLRLS